MLRTTIIESSLPYTRPVHVVGVSHQDKSNFVDERKFENLMKQEYPVNRVSFCRCAFKYNFNLCAFLVTNYRHRFGTTGAMLANANRAACMGSQDDFVMAALD